MDRTDNDEFNISRSWCGAGVVGLGCMASVAGDRDRAARLPEGVQRPGQEGDAVQRHSERADERVAVVDVFEQDRKEFTRLCRKTGAV